MKVKDSLQTTRRCCFRLYYLKTEAPLYIIAILDDIHRLDAQALAGYQDQFALITRLRKFLRI